jgi:hypothetical protein
MAAYDFGMAKARGLIAPIKEVEAALIDKAGGRNVFKSDDWWNDQYNKTIREGMQQFETGTEYKTKSGDYVLGKRTRYSSGGYAGVGGTMKTTYSAPQDAVITGYSRGGWYGPTVPRYDSRSVQVLGPDRKDLTQAQLDSITAASKAATKTALAESAKSAATSKRLKRATGGLLAKAPIPGTEGMATGLPVLGEGGLGLTASILGAGQKL